MASAAARLLFLAGFPVAVLEREQPLAVRRRVAFAEAVREGRAEVEGVRGRHVEASGLPAVAADFIPVVTDPEGRCLASLGATVIVDARMAKRNLGTSRADAPLVVALGPGFTAGDDAHAVVETQRGPDLGRVYWRGAAQADTGVPSPVDGKAAERVLRAPRAGTFAGGRSIGDRVEAGEVVGTVDGAPVRSGLAGLIRGLIADGVAVEEGTKVGDVDPRGRSANPAQVSDKARAVAAGVLEAVLIGLERLAR
jgi:xanthine dehydrogenase accessory factor